MRMDHLRAHYSANCPVTVDQRRSYQRTLPICRLLVWISVITLFVPTAWAESCGGAALHWKLANGHNQVVGTAAQVCSSNDLVRNTETVLASATYTPSAGTPPLPTPTNQDGACDAYFVTTYLPGPGCMGSCESTTQSSTSTRATYLAVVQGEPTYCPSAHAFAAAPAADQKSCCNPLHDPIDPTTGGMFLVETDVPDPEDRLRFHRYYNSANGGTVFLSPGWRHSLTRRIDARRAQSASLGLTNSADLSSGYPDEASACTSGFPEVKGRVHSWANAIATYDGSVCNLRVSGVNIGRLPIVWDGPIPGSPDVIAWDATRDDGQRVSFTVDGSMVNAPPTSGMRLQQTASGFLLTDENDTREQYDASGRLQSITTRAGVVVTLGYDSSGRLSTATDSFGHKLTLTYDGLNRLSTVADSAQHTVVYGYDLMGRLSIVTNADASRRTYLYENAGLPNAITGLVDESNNRYSTWSYDTQARVISTSEAGGAGAATLAYANQSPGSPVTDTDALGAIRVLTFDRFGDRNLVVGVSGSQCPTCSEALATTYDWRGFVSSRTDYNGNVTCYANDPERGLELVRVEGFTPGHSCPTDLTSYVAATGTRERKITTSWHSTFREPIAITESNRTTAFTYDAAGNALTKTVTDTSVTPNVSRTWAYTYDTYGRVLTADGPRTDVTDVTTYTYYTCTSGTECGQLHTLTNAAGQTTTYNTYNPHGQPLTITDPNGVVTTLTYDARQRLTSRQTGTESTTFEYWPTGLLKKVTLPDASYLFYVYDGAHRLTQISDGPGNSIDYTLDAMGNRTAENVYDPSNALQRTHTRVFNTLSQLYKDVNAAGTAAVTTTFGYDPQGNPTSNAAPLSRNTANAYDELNRLKQITDPASGLTQFGYDANDNLTSVTDPRSLTTIYTYNGFGDLKTLSSPDTGTTSDTYDSAGNLATSTDARGAVATYAYDALNRVSSVAYSLDGSTDQTISFTYDTGTNGKGHLTGASDANHSLSWSYDGLGRVTNKSQTVGGVIHSVGYGYTNGNLTSLTTASGQTITYGYNANHQVTSVAVNGTTVLNGVTYEPLGPVNGWTWGNGTSTTRTYDTDGKITQIVSAGTKIYSYDDAFRIIGISDTSPGASGWTYSYDALDRITTGSNASVTRGWSYLCPCQPPSTIIDVGVVHQAQLKAA
jgi:YD repeat-containing protein